MSCLSCLIFICVHCFFLKMMKLYKDICSAWISRTSAEILFSQINVINVSKIQWIYCYFTENTSIDPRKVKWWNKQGWRVKCNIGCNIGKRGRDRRKWFQEACRQNTSHWWCKNGNQTRIIKFTTHSFKEKVFLQHKRNKKIDNGKKKKNPKQ